MPPNGAGQGRRAELSGSRQVGSPQIQGYRGLACSRGFAVREGDLWICFRMRREAIHRK